ncbi:MAG: hypothetical protein QXN45_03655 [Candidatus Thermoplasmatota archaeon]
MGKEELLIRMSLQKGRHGFLFLPNVHYIPSNFFLAFYPFPERDYARKF